MANSLFFFNESTVLFSVPDDCYIVNLFSDYIFSFYGMDINGMFQNVKMLFGQRFLNFPLPYAVRIGCCFYCSEKD